MRIVDLNEELMRFVTLCSHIDDPNEERDSIAQVRESWLRENLTKGLKVKVAIDQGEPIGFAHCLPIELGTWGMSGKNLMTIPCLTLKYDRVYSQEKGSGAGRALVKAVEDEAKKEKKGVAVLAYDHDFWFMPASFFKKLGYKEVKRQGKKVIMLKSFKPVDPPILHKLNYKFNPVPGKVVVDIFWNPICLTSILEIYRVREICAEFGEKVVLNEYNCGKKENLEKYQTERALFINGKPKDWGYAAPKDEFRKEIEKCLNIYKMLEP